MGYTIWEIICPLHIKSDLSKMWAEVDKRWRTDYSCEQPEDWYCNSVHTQPSDCWRWRALAISLRSLEIWNSRKDEESKQTCACATDLNLAAWSGGLVWLKQTWHVETKRTGFVGKRSFVQNFYSEPHRVCWVRFPRQKFCAQLLGKFRHLPIWSKARELTGHPKIDLAHTGNDYLVLHTQPSIIYRAEHIPRWDAQRP